MSVALCLTPPLRAQLVPDGATATLANVTNTFTGGVTVGTNGSFTLLVLSNDCLLTNAGSSTIGQNATARSNEVRLASPSTRWLMGPNILGVGFNGSGNRLTISNGATASVNADANVGYASDSASNNQAWVTGPGSRWSSSGSINVGVLGAGNLAVVTNGGFASATHANLGVGSTSSNNLVLVTGAGSMWSNALNFLIGENGAGNRLIVSEGGAVRNGYSRIGNAATSSNNLALITGPGSVWSNSLGLEIGRSSLANNNQLIVSNGAAAVTAGLVTLGVSSNANGNTVTVTDAGSRWTVGALTIGSNGALNRLVIKNGAFVDSLNAMLGNRAAGTNNTALVTGSGSIWSNRTSLDIGGLGRGNQMVVSNGAWVISSTARLGVDASSSSNVAVVSGVGSVWSNRTSLSVGNIAPGNRLIVEAGGLVSSDSGVIGDFSSASNNEALVTGNGSLWMNAGSLIIGSQMPFNRLIVSNGAVVRSGSGTLGALNNLAVTGSGSIWSNATSLFLNGRADVTSGGWLACNDGSLGSSNSMVVLSGPSGWNNLGTLRVGDFANGSTLIASNGATLLSSNTFIGASTSLGNNNLALFTGTGTLCSNRNDFTIGNVNFGNRLVVRNGATVFDGGNVVAGLQSAATLNSILATDPGTRLLVASNLFVGSNGTSSLLVVSNSGTVSAGSIVVGATGSSTNNRVVVDGGTLRAMNAAGTSILDVRHGTNVLNSGLVDVDQLLLTNGGAIFTPREFGNSSSNYITEAPSSTVPSKASIYPSTIAVAGLNGSVTKVSVTLSNLAHTQPVGLDILLVSPAGQKVMLMSDAGGPTNLTSVRLDFDDSAATVIPDRTAPVTGTYRPTDYQPGETMISPAPAGPYATTLSAFNGSNPNGDWSLYINNDAISEFGRLVGWGLQITTDEPPNRGIFELNGGTLITRGAVISNGPRFVVGGPGGVPAVWEARAGLTGHSATRDVIVGGTFSSNNLLRVNGGTLSVLTPGTVLDVRGGTNRIDAGLEDVLQLLVTNTLGQFEMFGGTLRTPSTTVANGRVCVIGGGASLATFQMLGGTHTFANNLTVATNGALIGNGLVNGTVTVSPGGRLTPGAPIGRIDVDGSVILQGTVNVQIDRSGGVRTNDVVSASGAILYNGTLNVTDVGSDVLSAGDRFVLFPGMPYIGAFTTLHLPPLTPGLAWANNLSVDGSIAVVAGGQPGFASIRLSGTNVILAGTNGTPNGTYTVLAATNVALPLASWTSLATNPFSPSGAFSFTNAIVPGISQRFFRLSTP